MIYKCIFVAAILSIVGASPLKAKSAEEIIEIFNNGGPGRSSTIENLIINALEDFKETMKTGTDGIPILDPLHVERIVADDNTIPLPGARVEMTDLKVTGLSAYDVQEVSVTTISTILRRYEFKLQAEIPVVDVDIGSYDLLVNVWGFAFFGKGDANINIAKPWIKIDSNVNIRIGFLALYLNINELRIDFGLDDIEFNIKGMFDDPSVDFFINRFLRNLILEYVEFWMDDISDLISPAVKDVANDILSDINLIDIITPSQNKQKNNNNINNRTK